jgi:hypothetical protein
MQELGKLVGHLATPTCGLFALCHALPIFCAAKTAAQLTEVADGLDVDFVNSVWESFASKDLTGLAMDAYLAASLEELPQVRCHCFAPLPFPNPESDIRTRVPTRCRYLLWLCKGEVYATFEG